MAETFDVVQTNAATTSGAKLAGDTFTQSATDKFVPACYLVYGAAGGPYERVDTATPLPVTIISGTPSLNCEYADGATWTDGSSKGILNSGVYQASPQTISDGKVGPIQLTANGYQIVSVNGTVTVGAHEVTNAGTFAVQVDGAALTSLQIIDDWDESDRAKVNPIVGQAGVAAGSGATGATTQRIVSATDDPGVVSLAIVDDWDESDRAKVNVIVGQAGMTAGAGSVAANTPRVTLASDDPAVAKLGTIDVDTGNIATYASAIAGAVYVDDADFTDGVSKGLLGFGLYQSSPQSITDGDVGPLQVTQNGYLIVSIVGAVSLPTGAATAAKQPALGTAGTASSDVISIQGIASMTPVQIADNSGSLTVDNAGTFAVQVSSALPAGTNAIGKLAANTGVTIGAVELAAAQTLATVTAVSDAQVQGKAAHDAAASGNPVLLGAYASAAAPSDVSGDADAVRLWALRNGSPVCNLAVGGTLVTSSAGLPTIAVGDVAHDGVDAGNPVKVGFKAVAHGATPTEVAASDRVQWHANRAGVPFVVGGHPNVKCHAVLVPSGSAQTNAAIVSVSSGTKLVVTRITVVLDGDTAGPCDVKIGFATATLTSPNTTTAGTQILLQASGFGAATSTGVLNIGDGSGILGIGGDGEDLRYTCEDPGSGNLSISVSYYEVSS